MRTVRGERMVWKLITLPFRLLAALPGGLLVVLLLGSFALGVGALTRQALFNDLSIGLETVAPDATVRARQVRLVASLQARIDKETLRARNAEAAAADLKARNQVLAQTNDALGTANTALTQQNDKLGQDNAVLNADVARLRPLAARANVRWNGKEIPAAQAVSEATRTLGAGMRDAMLARLGAAPRQAVPFFGVPLIAADLGRDLAQACAQARLLAALDVAFGTRGAPAPATLCAISAPTAAALWSHARASALPGGAFGGDRAPGDARWPVPGLIAAGAGANPGSGRGAAGAVPPWWPAVMGWGDVVLPPAPAAGGRP